MISPLKFKLINLITFLTFSFAAQAWGPLGHEVVGHIAESKLSPLAKQKVKAILATTSLATASIWADQIRDKNHPENKLTAVVNPWHYINLDNDTDLDDLIHSDTGDVVLAIKEITLCLVTLNNKVKLDPKATCSFKAIKLTQLQVIKFLIHFVGDLHQPLHAGYAHDFGGNSVKIKFNNKNTNLHALWDSGLIDYRLSKELKKELVERGLENKELSYAEYDAIADKLSPVYAAELMKAASRNCSSVAAVNRNGSAVELNFKKILLEDSKALKLIYDQSNSNLLSKGDALSQQKYFDTFKPILDCQLYNGGLRLAELLNAIYKN